MALESSGISSAERRLPADFRIGLRMRFAAPHKQQGRHKLAARCTNAVLLHELRQMA